MDCYFRQSWRDSRLSFLGPIKSLSLSIKMLERIWRPDTYFYNGKHSYVHTITVPNKLLRINQDGDILYSMRSDGALREEIHSIVQQTAGLSRLRLPSRTSSSLFRDRWKNFFFSKLILLGENVENVLQLLRHFFISPSNFNRFIF